MYEEMKAKYINLKFHEGLPDSPYDLFASHERPGILFFDDLMGELTEKETKKKMEQWFTRGSHHHDITLMSNPNTEYSTRYIWWQLSG
ncbi:hypothetical protein QZH41_006854 [Actinostola sp. cb2023]|nr:hypothetical protein QZH41_006854 [Actinostola sp. cb2023]